MKRLMFLSALTVAAVLLAACEFYVAEVSSPISEPGLASYDDRLVGKWYLIRSSMIDGPSTEILTVVPGKDGFLDVAWALSSVESGDRKAGGLFWWMRWTAHASVIDGETYFNARTVDSAMFGKDAGEPPEIVDDTAWCCHPDHGYWIVRAEISEDDLLTLHFLWGPRLKPLGFAPREVACGEDCEFKVYDLSSEELVAAIRATEPGELFRAWSRYARIEGVYPPQPEE